MADLVLDGVCPEWTDAARRGWRSGSEPVVAIRGPADGVAGLERARAAAVGWIGRTGDGVVPLVDVTVAEDRVVWVYPRTHTLAAVHLTGPAEGDLLPPKAAAQLIGRIASILVGLGAEHPGPEPADVLVNTSGDVRLIGFVGPFPSSPEARAPLGASGAPAQVYRLGVLLARLLTGHAPTVGEDVTSHNRRVLRIAARALGRPGEPLPERYREWLIGMLAWEPEHRPPLSAVPGGLPEAAVEATGPGLREWASGQIATRIALLHLSPEPDDAMDLDELPSLTSEEIPMMREFAFGKTAPRMEWADAPPADEDPTAESEAGGVVPQTGLLLESGSIPVLVGPPPEAHRGRPRLSLPNSTFPRSAAARLPVGARGWLVLGLSVSAALALVYGVLLVSAMW
ncbi:MAG: hypothetical protein H0V89_11365 [Deltaproteobacteria bacterium]|nr:hypothetical protein [Deltaproteobacteria bacterium]